MENDIAPAVGAASRGMIAAMMAGLARRGFGDMTPAFASLIPQLDATGARPSALAQRAGITKQAISQLVHELETRGYVEQVADPTDTRAKIVRLTAQGVALRSACADVRRELHALAADLLGQARLEKLRQGLQRLAEALNASAAARAAASKARRAKT